MELKIKGAAQTPQLPGRGERELEKQFVRRFGAGLALCVLAGLLFSFNAPHTQTKMEEAREDLATMTTVSLEALDFADAAFARAQQTADWRYDAAWAKQYPGLATYRSGDNFVTCGTIVTARDAQDALDVLLQESGLSFVQDGASGENDMLLCYTAPFDAASVRLYVLTQENDDSGTTLVWAQAYLADAPPPEKTDAVASADQFVRQMLHVAPV